MAKRRFPGGFLLVSLLTGCGASHPAGPFDASAARAGDVRQAGYYTSLYSFAGAPDGERPLAGLIVDGEFYGTTSLGGYKNKCHNGCGTVFKLSAQGRERVVHLFKGTPDGANPQAPLTELNGELFGTTYSGGKGACSGGCGVVFTIELGRERLIYSFKGGADGAHPEGTIVAIYGKLYGTTFAGGAQGKGTFFAVTPSGKEQVLYSFKGAPDDGDGPLGSLAEVSGALYGVTERGGQDNAGTVFHFQPSGVEELVHSFDPATDGSAPTGLVNFPDSDTMYGTAASGGTHKLGTLFFVLPNTSFRAVYSFRGHAKGDGAYPEAPPTVVDYTLYGTTRGGGSHGNGTVYEMNIYTNEESVLYNFGTVPDGAHPMAPLLEDGGVLYGTTANGGSRGNELGTIFRIEP
ncbi:MAG: choice-of-anchor tandem repeat GloVer-containing protein [Candidatus Cybelea sp.]